MKILVTNNIIFIDFWYTIYKIKITFKNIMTLFRKYARYSAPQNNIKTNQVVIGCIYGSKEYKENMNY